MIETIRRALSGRTAEGRTMRAWLLPAAVALIGCAGVPPSPAPIDVDQRPAADALPVLAQQLLDALPHDAAVWERYVSPQALYVSEAGDVATRAELLEGFRPFPPGLSGSIRVQDPRVTDFGEFATIVFDGLERQRVYEQEIEVQYLSSQVWRREQGRWRMVLAQAGVRTRDPAPTLADSRRFKDFAGLYTLSGQRELAVEVRDGTLFAGPPGTELKALIPVGDNVFAERGNPLGVLRIFVRGKGGKADRMIQRRKHADLEWRRVR